MEFFINEISLEYPFFEIEDFRKAVKNFLSLFNYIKDNIKDKKIYKDGQMITRFSTTGNYFLTNFNKLNKDIRDAFRQIIFNKINPIDWRNEALHNIEDNYICPDINNLQVSNTSVAESAERKYRNSKSNQILINLAVSKFDITLNNKLYVLKNSDIKIILDFIKNISDFEKIYHFEQEPLESFLFDNTRFRKTNFIVQGRCVYLEIKTSRLWYLDNKHRNHFEVFTSSKNHLGEASLGGDIDTSKAVEGRIFEY